MTDQKMESANKEYTKALEKWAAINGDPQLVMQLAFDKSEKAHNPKLEKEEPR